MLNCAIVYHSSHLGNTKKLVDAIAQGHTVTLIDASREPQADLRPYDLIGFASGIYGGRFHRSVLALARDRLPEGRRVFFLCTYGGRPNYKAISQAVQARSAVEAGRFGCRGFDTFGPFKLVGGIAKGRPNQQDLEAACRFFQGLCGPEAGQAPN